MSRATRIAAGVATIVFGALPATALGSFAALGALYAVGGSANGILLAAFVALGALGTAGLWGAAFAPGNGWVTGFLLCGLAAIAGLQIFWPRRDIDSVITLWAIVCPALVACFHLLYAWTQNGAASTRVR